MSTVSKALHYLFNNPSKLFRVFFLWLTQNRVLCHLISSRLHILVGFREALGKYPDLKNPKTFNEKLQWLKLYDRQPRYTQMVDKYAVRQFISEKLGEEYLIPLLGVWDCFEDIDFNALPNQFVLKPTHTSGNIFICRDKRAIDYSRLRHEVNRWLKRRYYWVHREWPYKNLPRRIIAEQYISESDNELRDYKFFCFGGKVKCFKIDYDRFVEHRANYYDTKKELLPFGEEVCPPDFERKIDIPKNIDDMIALAEKLSEGHPFLRVDFYSVAGKIYFGELTFFPASGFGPFIPEEWDYKLGEWIKLPDKN